MAKGTLAEAAQAMTGQLIAGEGEAIWSGASIDSRKVRRGELFFALPGAQTDGHRFVADALSRGAAAAVVHAPVERPADSALILVEDTLEAFHDLTRSVRSRTPEHLVGVTGSAGKTTTKDLLTLMLAPRYRVAGSPGNLNNLFGFPLALLSIPDGTEWMVAEMGMSTPGELSRLSRIARPEAVVITNVRPVHLEFFGSLRRIAEAKAELLEGLVPDGLLVANADDREVSRIASRHEGRVVLFGKSESAEHRVEQIEILPDGSSRFVWKVRGVDRPMSLPLLGEHNVLNFLAAAACAVEVGVEPEEIAEAVKVAVPSTGRGVVHRVGGATIVDDSYNSNPAALTASLQSVRALPGERHWAILGDMLELGEESESFHRAAGTETVNEGFSLVFGVGELSRVLIDAVVEAGGEGHWYPSAKEAAVAALQRLQGDDVLLIKASRGIGLDLVVERLLSGGAD